MNMMLRFLLKERVCAIADLDYIKVGHKAVWMLKHCQDGVEMCIQVYN